MIAYVEDDFLVVATFQLLVQRVDVANLGGHLLPPPLKASPAQKKRHTKGRKANTFPGSESPAAAIKSKRKNPIAVEMSLSVFISLCFKVSKKKSGIPTNLTFIITY